MENSINRVYILEELAANAWTAEVVQLVDGWRFRYSPGIRSRRINSVWPNNPGQYLTLKQKLELVEAFYARRELPTRFQISPAAQPAELDGILAQRGYTLDAPTFVQTARISDILDRLPPNPGAAVSLHSELPDAFSAFQQRQYDLSREQVAARKAAFGRIGPRTIFALVEMDGETAGIGIGILERGWLGVFSMLTHPEMRQQGVATAVLRTLAEWGQSLGAAHAYLQVMENNPAALNLYGRAGFIPQYQYHYRQSP